MAVVMLPGPTDSWRSCGPVLDRLPEGVRAIAVSQRGHGESSRPPDGYGVDDFAGDVVPVMDRIGLDRAVLVGHSGSCLAARRVALDHPDRVAGLVLEASPTTLRDDPRLGDLVRDVLSALRDPPDPGFVRSWVVGTSSARVDPDLIDVLVHETSAVPATVWRQTFAGLLGYDDRDRLSGIVAPTLLIWGDADAVVPRSMQEELVASIPDARLVVYPGAGHTPRWEDPDRFARDLAEFATFG